MSTPRELTKDEAVALAASGFWRDLSHRERAEFQMHVKKLCMPFSVFHEALEKALGRPVWTHEMGLNWDGLAAELRGDRPESTLKEILNLIPAEKRIVIQP